MSKYTDQELQDMAIHVLESELKGEEEAKILLITMARATGLHPAQVRERLIDLAKLQEVV